MALTNLMFRGRNIRINRSHRNRPEYEEEIQLDLNQDSSELYYEVLSNICKKDLTNGKKFSYINALVTLTTKADPASLQGGPSIEDILCCLRLGLVHDATQVRAASLRCTRYIVKTDKDFHILIKLCYPSLISRCLDIHLKNAMERVQALKLIRHLITLDPDSIPIHFVRSLLSIAEGGTEQKDRMVRASLATLAEICVLNPSLFIDCGGVSALTHSLLENSLDRISEALCGALLFLLNKPETRRRAKVKLHILAGPYCDFHLHASQNREERDLRFQCTRVALISILRSWPGLIHFCKPSDSSSLKALVDILYLNQLDVRKAILELLYEVLNLNQPEWTDEFSVALEVIDNSKGQETWRLNEGFVAAEAKNLLPHLAKYRPNLVEIHLALLLYAFLETGLVSAIVEVILTSDTFISVRATILLGQMLHMIHRLVPTECRDLSPAMPALLNIGNDGERKTRAASAISMLAQVHSVLGKPSSYSSLFLAQHLHPTLIRRPRLPSSLIRVQISSKELDEMLKESAVLNFKDGHAWNWPVIRAILKNRNESFLRLEDGSCRTFIKRLVNYLRPSSNRFCRLELLTKDRTKSLAACELIDFLLTTRDENVSGSGEGIRLLTDCLEDIHSHLVELMAPSKKSAHDCLFSPHHVTNTHCQDYFLLIGRLSRTSFGCQLLERCKIFEVFLELVANTNHECYIKLIISSLDYIRDGLARVIFSKVLTGGSEAGQLYATQFLIVGMRSMQEGFERWGLELLVSQLYDPSKSISMIALSLLTEATFHKPYLKSLVKLRPSVLHLGDRGMLLLVTFLSTIEGFSYLHEAHFVTTQLEKWFTSFNSRYVFLVEGDLHDSLTLHQRNDDGRYSRRNSNVRPRLKNLFVPPHLYGQLAQHSAGINILTSHGHLTELTQTIAEGRSYSLDDILKVKAALWAIGHIATSESGATLVSSSLPHICHLARECPVLSIRGTAIHALSLYATTRTGAGILEENGWAVVRHDRHTRWPILEDSSSQVTFSVEEEQNSTDIAESNTTTSPLLNLLPNSINRHNRSLSECGPLIHSDWAASSSSPLKSTSSTLNTKIFSKPRAESDCGVTTPRLSPILSSGTLLPSQLSTTKPHRKLSVQSENVKSSGGSPDTRLSYQDIIGYATLRILNRPRRPLLSEECAPGGPRSLKARSLDRNNSLMHMMEFNSLLEGHSLSSLSTRTSNFRAKHDGDAIGEESVESVSTRLNEIPQCFMGITLPLDINWLFLPEEDRFVFSNVNSETQEIPSTNPLSSDFFTPENTEMEPTSSSDSELELLDSGAGSVRRTFGSKHEVHECVLCCRHRTRKISASSYHRNRTDTESSYGGGESPVLVPRRRRRHSRNSSICLLNANSASIDSSISLDLGGRSSEEPYSSIWNNSRFVRKEILKHVIRLSNPVWIKSSKQVLLQLKQKFGNIFQDICLYSEVSAKLATASYRLSARRLIQELFYDLTFDQLYEEPLLSIRTPGAIENNCDSPSNPRTSIQPQLPSSPQQQTQLVLTSVREEDQQSTTPLQTPSSIPPQQRQRKIATSSPSSPFLEKPPLNN